MLAHNITLNFMECINRQYSVTIFVWCSWWFLYTFWCPAFRFIFMSRFFRLPPFFCLSWFRFFCLSRFRFFCLSRLRSLFLSRFFCLFQIFCHVNQIVATDTSCSICDKSPRSSLEECDRFVVPWYLRDGTWWVEPGWGIGQEKPVPNWSGPTQNHDFCGTQLL